MVSAANQTLADLVTQGRFRSDLYYRLRVVPIRIPPLRNRRDDIPLLAGHFVNRFAQKTGRSVTGIHETALSLLIDYSWLGNVRELENVIEYAFVKVREGLIRIEHLPPELRECVLRSLGPHLQLQSNRRSDLTIEAVRDALTRSGWNIAGAARRLRVSRTTLYKRIQQSGLRPLDI